MIMDHEEGQTELGQIAKRLQEDGLSPEASVEERQRYLWKQLLGTEAEFRSATQELQTLRSQQANEMEEVESYVAHIRGLLEERECLTAEYERDNEHLRQELHQIRQQQESQSKELAEMLAQEDLGEMGLSGPSEQVAYLLVERATLMERLEAAERRLESQSLTDKLREAQHQQCSSKSPLKKLFGLRRSAQSKHNITPAHNEEISQESDKCQRLERDLEEASQRLTMAHQDIRRLTNELDAGSELQRMDQEVENLRKEVGKLKHCDTMKLQRAKEQNDSLDAENKALRERMRTSESDKKNLLDQLSLNDASRDSVTKEDQKDKSVNSELQNNLSDYCKHSRCREMMEDGFVQVKELKRQLQKLRKGQEELEERNEELEALLGEAQNTSKEDRHRHEGELEGLHRRIRGLEAELKKQDVQEKKTNNGEEVKTTESYLRTLRDRSEERLALLEARLAEEEDWRKQLEVDLSAAQTALRKDKEGLQISEREREKLRLEVNSLQTECQQGKTLIKSLTQVKGEKAVLEEKLALMERTNSGLQSELESYKEGNRTHEGLRKDRLQVEQLEKQVNRRTAELCTLQTEHNALRSELVSERQQTAELQAKLSSSVQEKLTAEEEREGLKLELQHLKELVEWHREHLSLTKEGLNSSQMPKLQHTAHVESRLSPVEEGRDGSLDQISCLKQELDHLQTNLEQERQLASKHQLTLQSQASEAKAHIKSQDLVLSQKAEEAKQMKQDLQRATSLFNSAERELHYEKEKNMDLKRHNTLLDQEKLKLCAEVKQLQTKLVVVEQTVQTGVTECERQKQKIRKLELELARNSTNLSAATNLKEELQAQRAQLIAADKKVLELQQQLKSAQHQLHVEEARTDESSRLERDCRDLSDALSALKTRQQEEHMTRKLLEQREEELQQQVQSLKRNEAFVTTTNAELSQRVQQLNIRVGIVVAELSKTREEANDSQKLGQKLQEDLVTSQLECDRLKEELQQVLLQLDTHVRKYNEKQSQHKAKMRQVKQVFLKATSQRDCTIQKLEHDLHLASSLSHKEKERIHTVMKENEKLLEEKRELLQKTSEAEEMASQGMKTASTAKHRVNVLEVENRQLQDRTLKLSNQVSSLERSMRSVHFYSLEGTKKVLPSESLCDGILHTSTLSLTSGPCDPLDIVDAICHMKVGERVMVDSTRSSLSTHQPSEQGYLNLTSPLGPPVTKGTEESSNNSDQV